MPYLVLTRDGNYLVGTTTLATEAEVQEYLDTTRRTHLVRGWTEAPALDCRLALTKDGVIRTARVTSF